MDIKKFLKSWNGILFIFFIGIYLMFPAIKSLFPADDAAQASEASQVQSFVGALAVIWALRAIWGKQRGKDDEEA